jgi:hypothetical protein
LPSFDGMGRECYQRPATLPERNEQPAILANWREGRDSMRTSHDELAFVEWWSRLSR